MTVKNIISGDNIEISVRPNATDYEIRQETIRESAKLWQTETAEKSLSYGELLHDVRIFETQAKRFGLQKELRENGII
jgi:hypothetical protein